MLPQPQRNLGNHYTLSSFPHPCKEPEKSHFSTQRHLTCGRCPSTEMDFIDIICNQLKQTMILLRLNISHGFITELGFSPFFARNMQQ